MRITDAIEGYWLERRRDVSVHTFNDYDRTLRRFAGYVGDLELGDIGPDHVRGYLNGLAEAGLADKTVCNAWIALSSFWTWAAVELGVEHAIRGRVQRPRWRRKQIRPYSHGEIQALLAACAEGPTWTTKGGRQARSRRPSALRDKAIIVALVDTGVRAQELCDLRLADYAKEAGRLLVRHGKGDKERFVYLGDAGRRALWRYMAERPSALGAAPLFSTAKDTAMDRGNLRRLIQTIARNAGVSGATVHRFRHTFAINFLRNGGSVLALQSLLGHERMDTVRIYAQLADVDLQDAQRKASPADGWRL